MDQNSRHLVSILNAIAETIDQLRKFGYGLYLKTKAHGWTNPSGVGVGGQGIAKGGIHLSTGVWLDASGDRRIVFGITFRWDDSNLYIQSYIDDEDGNRDPTTKGLWESSEYCADTIDEAIRLLQETATQLMASIGDPFVAECVKTIAPRQPRNP
jgi:hypothetical protein